MPMIEIDFETFKEITRRRPNEKVSEGDVVREALGLNAPSAGLIETGADYWESEGVKFPVGTRLEHRFRDGRIVEAQITPRGVEVGGTIYSGLSPAGASVTKHQLNGWLFWFLRDDDGRLVAADTLRKK
jgi:hypothetical protein